MSSTAARIATLSLWVAAVRRHTCRRQSTYSGVLVTAAMRGQTLPVLDHCTNDNWWSRPTPAHRSFGSPQFTRPTLSPHPPPAMSRSLDVIRAHRDDHSVSMRCSTAVRTVAYTSSGWSDGSSRSMISMADGGSWKCNRVLCAFGCRSQRHSQRSPSSCPST